LDSSFEIFLKLQQIMVCTAALANGQAFACKLRGAALF